MSLQVVCRLVEGRSLFLLTVFTFPMLEVEIAKELAMVVNHLSRRLFSTTTTSNIATSFGVLLLERCRPLLDMTGRQYGVECRLSGMDGD